MPLEDSSHPEVSAESEMTEVKCERAVYEKSVSDASNDSFRSRGLVAAKESTTLIVMESDRASVTSGEESSQLTSSNDLLQDRLSHLRIIVVHDRHWLPIYQELKQVEFRSSRLTVELVPRGKLQESFLVFISCFRAARLQDRMARPPCCFPRSKRSLRCRVKMPATDFQGRQEIVISPS